RGLTRAATPSATAQPRARPACLSTSTPLTRAAPMAAPPARLYRRRACRLRRLRRNHAAQNAAALGADEHARIRGAVDRRHRALAAHVDLAPVAAVEANAQPDRHRRLSRQPDRVEVARVRAPQAVDDLGQRAAGAVDQL